MADFFFQCEGWTSGQKSSFDFESGICSAGLQMRPAIKDEFTHLKISRQRKYQLRMLRDKRCMVCGAPAREGTRCVKHLVLLRERNRARYGNKRRYFSTLSYRLEAQAGTGRRGRRKASG